MAYLQPRLDTMPLIGLQLLLHCLQQVSARGLQFPHRFMASLEQAMVPLLPQLPSGTLLAVAAVFSSCQHKPGRTFLSAYALVTAERMPELCMKDIEQLVQNCGSISAAMPNLWHLAAWNQVQQRQTGMAVKATAADASLKRK